MNKNGRLEVRIIAIVAEAYRLSLGMILPHACRFHPTCSVYLVQAVAEHGLWRGLLLAAGRVLRCHPLHPGGYDPVPPNINR